VTQAGGVHQSLTVVGTRIGAGFDEAEHDAKISSRGGDAKQCFVRVCRSESASQRRVGICASFEQQRDVPATSAGDCVTQNICVVAPYIRVGAGIEQQFDKLAAFLSGRMPQGAPLMGIARVRVCPSRDKGARALGLTVIGGADQRVMPIASVFWGHAERQEKPHSFGIAAGSCLTQRLY
jgi:hypothetical protein